MCRCTFAPFGRTVAPREGRPNPIKMCNAAQTPANDLLGHNVGATGVRFSALWTRKDESETGSRPQSWVGMGESRLRGDGVVYGGGWVGGGGGGYGKGVRGGGGEGREGA